MADSAASTRLPAKRAELVGQFRLDGDAAQLSWKSANYVRHSTAILIHIDHQRGVPGIVQIHRRAKNIRPIHDLRRHFSLHGHYRPNARVALVQHTIRRIRPRDTGNKGCSER